MAKEGLRVLAVAERELDTMPGDVSPAAIETDLTFLGLVGLLDPPRPEARAAIEECASAGMRVVMLTGDHPATAAAVARDLGIIAGGDAVISGPELAQLSDEALARTVATARVYARVDPAHKIKIVAALQKQGQLVAMTGDGVNDAPALKRANIGIAMGRSGTDVAREAAHMVLLDDNFATIVAAVREGRRIYDNIRKFVRYVLTCNSAEIWTLFLAPMLGLPVPLLPIHILWINLVTDGLPGLALTVEPEEGNLMRRPPRPPEESMFAHGLWQHVLWVGFVMGAATLCTQAWSLPLRLGTLAEHDVHRAGVSPARPRAGHPLGARVAITLGLFSNLPLFGAVVLTVALQLATLYVPVFNAVFKTEPLTARELSFCLAFSTVGFLAVEAEKNVSRNRRSWCIPCGAPSCLLRFPRWAPFWCSCRAGCWCRSASRRGGRWGASPCPGWIGSWVASLRT